MNLEGKISLIKSAIQSIKQAIIGKGQTPSGNLTTYATAIDNIVTTNNQDKTVTQNGVVRCDVGYTGLGDVTVNVNQSVQNKTITENGEYTADSGYIGLGTVTVNTPIFIGINREVINGEYKPPTTSFTWSLPSNATSIKDYCLYYAFYGCTGVTNVDMSSLTTIRGIGTMSSTFEKCVNLTSVNLSGLTLIGDNDGYTMQKTFKDCSSLTSINLSSLTDVVGTNAMSYAFSYCTSLTTLSFPSLIRNSFRTYTNQFKNMLQGVTGCTVHFPMNLSDVLGSTTDVTNGFGGTNTTVLFDLPATT